MSKDPSDSSRFTQTTPYATRPISPRLSTAKTLDKQPTRPPITSAAVGIETPAQKVARLRAAHLAKRAAEISTWDIIVVRGREIADVAHRWTVITIVAASVILIGVTAFTMSDMVRYNRKKKREFYEMQSHMLKQAFVEALEAEGNGTATEDQIKLLREEREMAAAEEVKKEKAGIWNGIKGIVSRGLDTKLGKEDRKYGEKRKKILERLEEHENNVLSGTAVATFSPTLQAVQQKRMELERQLQDQSVEPAPVDRLAEEATIKIQQKSKSWFSWFS